eukprot:15435784-Alexandrium_andersonii.AAC.1
MQGVGRDAPSGTWLGPIVASQNTERPCSRRQYDQNRPVQAKVCMPEPIQAAQSQRRRQHAFTTTKLPPAGHSMFTTTALPHRHPHLESK